MHIRDVYSLERCISWNCFRIPGLVRPFQTIPAMVDALQCLLMVRAHQSDTLLPVPPNFSKIQDAEVSTIELYFGGSCVLRLKSSIVLIIAVKFVLHCKIIQAITRVVNMVLEHKIRIHVPTL